MKLGRSFYTRNSVTQIARELLGKYIYTKFDGEITGGMITETEAYEGITDKASHAYNNCRTNRTEIMFANGGVAYVYLCYGIHHLFNIVTNTRNIPHAILIRGIYPTEGIKMMEMRKGKTFINNEFSNGPGKISKVLGIKVQLTGESLLGEKIWLEDRGFKIEKNEIITGSRIGVEYAGEDAKLPYRFLVKNETISRA
ncbi:MAG: DNA-3-methyladenine glycosylase [Bacteroidales bacterium]|nr:DNA-3-methyladenine glycosylase [Bacteroidales bacterium]